MMTKPSRCLPLIVLPAVLLQACVSVGTPSTLDELAVARLTPLRSTKQDMARSLGEPTHPESTARRPRATGKIVEVWTYDYTHVDISPLTVIPLLGPFLGSSSVTTASVIVRLDKDGVIQHVDQAPFFDPRLGYEGFDFQLPLY